MLLLALSAGLILLGVSSAQSGITESLLVSAFAGLTLVAWAIAYVGVRHSRCGDLPNWVPALRAHRQLFIWWPQRRVPFTSAAQAHVWRGWRRGGQALPFVTGLILAMTLWPLWLGKNDVHSAEQTLLSAVASTVFLAGMFGISGGVDGDGLNRRVLGSFTATLPMTTAGMLGAMLRVAARSTLLSWALMAVAIPIAVVLTGNLDVVSDWSRRVLDAQQPMHVAVGIVATATLLFIWTWKRQVDGLHARLMGRRWVTYIIVWVCFPGSIFLCFLADWFRQRPETHETVFAVLPWLLGTLVICRLLIVAWALRQVLRRRLLRPRTVARWIGGWLLLASILFAMLAWAIPAKMVPMGYIAFIVLFAMPMARLAAAPLALAWNRHR